MRKNFLIVLSVSLIAALWLNVAGAQEEKIVASYEGRKITEKELLKESRSAIMKQLAKIYQVQRNILDRMISEDLLERESKGQKLTKAELITKNVTSKVKDATDAELKAFYNRVRNSRNYRGKKFEDAKPILKRHYRSEKSQEFMSDYLDTLFAKYKVSLALDRPTSEVSVDDDPGMGNPKAPVVIIEFSDFQCPYCKKTRPVIDRIMKDYKGKVYYVFRDFPLSFHKQAKDAASAAHCAGEQGKYWEYNDQLWKKQGKLKKLETLDEIAVELKLDQNKFKSCLKSKKYHAEVDKDMKEGATAGVSGTPAYFINGVFLSGAQPYEAFKEIIDEELAKNNG